MKGLLIVAVTALVVTCARTEEPPQPNTWYVDAANDGKSGMDGSSEKPYGTIQEAIDAAATVAGDTILVRPGVYTNGVQTGSGIPYPCRVYVRKNVRIISTGGKDVTVIGGVRDPSDAHGKGAASVACVYFDSSAAGLTDDNVVLEGFTLCNGTVGDTSSGYGGGVAQSAWYPNRTNYHVIDCIISNCSSRVRVNSCVSLHRCIVTRNWSDAHGAGIGDGFAENTLFFANSSASGSCVYGGRTVSCTVTGHSGGKALYAPSCLINSIIALNGSDRCNDPYGYLTNSVVSTFDCDNPETRFPNAYNSALGVASTNVFYAPIFGDCRPIATSPAVGRADARLLTRVPLPSDYVYKDLAGTVIDVTSETPIQAGAHQGTVDVSEKGCVMLTTQGGDYTALDSIKVNGVTVPHPNILYSYMDSYPGLVSFGSASASAPLSNVKNPFVKGDFRFAGYDGLCWLPRPKPGVAASYPVSCATRFYHVDPRGNDAWDGSCAYESRDESKKKGPWQTLAMPATNSVVNNDRRSMIYCAAGIYDTGKVGRYRVNVSANSGRRPHFVSADGRGKAVIVGAADPDTSDGNGPKAVSCIHGAATKAEYAVGFVGFAITGGHSPAASSTWGADFGAICRNEGSGGLTISDSIITNNVGAQGLIYSVRVERCLIANNKSTYKSTFGSSTFAGCLFRDNDTAAYTGWFTDSAVLVNCHLAQTTTAGVTGYVINSGANGVHNSVFTDCTGCHKVTESRGCVFDHCAGNFVNVTDSFTGDARLAFKAGGDYRPLPDSPVWTQAVSDIDDLFHYGATDYNGVPVFDDARLRGAGAFLAPARDVVSVEDPDGRLTVSGLTAGSHVFTDGMTLTIAPNAASTRPVVGWSADGTNYYFNAAASKSFTYADVTSAAGGYLKLAPVLGCEWFANPNTDSAAGVVGSDDNHGFSRHFPKKTLAEALKNAASNDTVWAAAGVYAEKTMNPNGYLTPARADVPACVTLRSEDDDPETTVIAGAAGDGENGTGADAVRCVVLRKGALIRGFTCTGGRMRDNTKDTSVQYSAPGICSYTYSAQDTYSENCIVSNCIAQYFILMGGVHRNLRVLANTTFNRGLGYTVSLYNCLFSGNRLPSGTQAFMYGTAFQNISFLPDNVFVTDGSRFTGTLVYATSYAIPIVNSLICANCDPNPTTNCVFLLGSKRNTFVNPRYCSSVEELKLDGWVPQLDSPLVDYGTNDCVCVTDSACYSVDCRGLPRVSNGRIDVGAVEADWRPTYAADIRRSLVEVVSATPSVYETAEKTVALGKAGEGGALGVARRPSASDGFDAVYSFLVSGNGVLTVRSGDVVLGTFGPSADRQTLKVDASVASLTFAYEPGADDTGTAEILRARFDRGLLMMVR